MDQIWAALDGQWGGAAVMFTVGLLALTGKIQWHTVAEKEAARGDRWENLALGLLQPVQKLADAAEVTSEVVSRLPVPPEPEVPAS